MFDSDDYADYSMAGFSYEDDDYSDEMIDDDYEDDFEEDESDGYDDFGDNLFGESPDIYDEPYDCQEAEDGYTNRIGFDDDFYAESEREEIEEDS